MPKGLPQSVKDCLEKCQSAAIAAVECYNRPGPRFRTAQYLILITIAWSALFHAIFYKKGRRPWYRSRGASAGKGTRYQKVDGEPRHWDLSESLRQYFADRNPPERKNLEFLLGLRNKIEHRHLPELDPALFGECQAALINLEELLVQEFGPKYALADQLAISLQFTRIVPEEKAKAARALASSSAQTVREYVERFRGSLPGPTLNSMKYSFSVFLVPRIANRQSAADVSVQFVSADEASDEELSRLEKLNVLIREKQIPIANLGFHKPGEIVAMLRVRLPHAVTMATHTAAWKHWKVRPPKDDPHPERTSPEYCHFDSVHRDYVYTPAWVERLVRELTPPARFEEVTGRAPVPK